MISIIICSRDSVFLASLSKNIQETIGIAYEIIAINNKDNKYTVCSAYNEGAYKAKFQYLCFVHEDVKFITQNWGQVIISHFAADSQTGLLGLAGSVYKTKMASGWWEYENNWDECRRINIIQHYKDSGAVIEKNINPLNETSSQVAVIDGVFMVTQKKIWELNKFDEVLLTGFHGYDLDFSLQIAQSKKLYVVYDILIDHFSSGNNNIDWLQATLKVHIKWAKHLPIIIKQCDTQSVYENGWKRLRKNMGFLLANKKNFITVIKYYNQFYCLLDERPSFFIFMKDYIWGFVKICKLYMQRKTSLNW